MEYSEIVNGMHCLHETQNDPVNYTGVPAKKQRLDFYTRISNLRSFIRC